MTITKKIAAETDKARRHKVATTIRVRGAKSTKAAEMRASQKTSITDNGGGN